MTTRNRYELGSHEVDNLNVGDGATYHLWTDAHAGTVVEKTDTKLVLRRDKATLLNGPNSGEEDALVVHPGGFAAHVSGKSRYSYEPDPNGVTYTFTRRVKTFGNGKTRVIWKLKGSKTTDARNDVSAGRKENYDFNF